MAKKNPILDYRIATYPTPQRFKIFISYAAISGQTKSKALYEMMNKFIELNFSEQKQREMIDFYNKMTAEQIKNPDKYWQLKK